ncbi:MAG: hypothetical protein NTY22_04985 [Proteobacteria bacterium]|nr:hypothetical protein [Pseudomonadota bacterium]
MSRAQIRAIYGFMAVRICIVSLEGTLQTLMLTALFTCIKNKDKDAHITLILDKKDKNITDIIGDVDAFLFFDKDSTIDRLSSDNHTLLNNNEYIKKQLRDLTSQPFDLVINTGPDNLSSIVASMVDARSIEGVVYDEYGKKWIENPWLAYLNSVYEDDHSNLFHYVDLITAGCNAFRSIKSVMSDTGALCKRILIDLNDYKEGSVLARELNKKIETEYKNFTVTITDEKLSIKDMSELIKNSSIVITSNYIWSTVACYYGKKVIFVASDDKYVMNGPYGEGHLILKARSEGADVKEDLFNLFEFAFCQKDKNTLITSSTDVFVSRYDNDGFMEYVPFLKAAMSDHELYRWIYKAVFKGTIGRSVKAGDPQRFLAFGEKYIDRVVDIDRAVEYLSEKIFTKYEAESVKKVMNGFNEAINSVVELKQVAFEGQKKSREFLNIIAINSGDLDEIKKKRKELTETDNLIYKMLKDGKWYLGPIIRTFMKERDDSHIVNLFPLAKRTIVNYEDLFSKASFLEEIIRGLWKRIN